MEVEEKIKTLARMGVFGIKKLIKVGDSYAIIIPLPWLNMNATKINDDYYMTIRVENNSLICSPVDENDIGKLTFKEK